MRGVVIYCDIVQKGVVDATKLCPGEFMFEDAESAMVNAEAHFMPQQTKLHEPTLNLAAQNILPQQHMLCS